MVKDLFEPIVFAGLLLVVTAGAAAGARAAVLNGSSLERAALRGGEQYGEIPCGVCYNGTGFSADLLPGTTGTVTIAGVAPPAKFCGVRPTMVGTDVPRGALGRDVIAGRGGEDLIYELGGDDTLCGSAGNDTIYGAARTDVLDGGPGRNACTSGERVASCEQTGSPTAPSGWKAMPAPPPPLPASTFTFGREVPAKQRKEVQDAIARAASYVQTTLGVKAPTFKVFAYGNLDSLVDAYVRWLKLPPAAAARKKAGWGGAEEAAGAVFLYVRNQQWAQSSAANRAKILSHEYFHVIQEHLHKKALLPHSAGPSTSRGPGLADRRIGRVRRHEDRRGRGPAELRDDSVGCRRGGASRPDASSLTGDAGWFPIGRSASVPARHRRSDCKDRAPGARRLLDGDWSRHELAGSVQDGVRPLGRCVLHRIRAVSNGIALRGASELLEAV